MSKIHTVIVAGGSGSRFGSDVPKQYCLLEGRPVLMHTIDTFRQALPDSEITLVISQEIHPLWNNLCQSHRFNSPNVVYGGSTRSRSVSNALNSINCESPDDIVLVHDGARPLVDRDTILRVLNKIKTDRPDGVIPVIDVTDSLRQLDHNGSHPVDRSIFRAVQTPQGFLLARLQQAYSQPEQSSWTDDASVMASAGKNNIVLVDGSPLNIKITNPLDLDIAATILRHHSK